MNNREVLRDVCDAYLEELSKNIIVAAKWWNIPNEAFYNEAPEDVFRRDPMAVVRYLRCVYAFETRMEDK